jgi:hypothetical protein
MRAAAAVVGVVSVIVTAAAVITVVMRAATIVVGVVTVVMAAAGVVTVVVRAATVITMSRPATWLRVRDHLTEKPNRVGVHVDMDPVQFHADFPVK